MNLQQLEYLKMIAETENYTVASKRLSVSQPALSKSIANLEDELQVPLFIKDGRKMKLSKYGKIFLSYAEAALTEISNGIEEIQKLIQPETGTLTIGTTTNIGIHFLPAILSSFMMEHPNSNFQFHYQPNETLFHNLLQHSIDFAFFDCHTISSLPAGIVSLPIRHEEYVLIVPKNHPMASLTEVSLRDLKDEAFISSCNISEEQLASCSELIGYTPKIAIQPTEPSMVEGLVAAGAGIAIVSNTPLMNTNIFSSIKLKENICYRTIYMAWDPSLTMPPAAKEFLNYIRNTTHENISNA